MILTPYRKEQMVETLKSALAALEFMPTSTPCVACLNWKEGYCIHWQATPPEDAQQQGCAEFAEDAPF